MCVVIPPMNLVLSLVGKKSVACSGSYSLVNIIEKHSKLFALENKNTFVIGQGQVVLPGFNPFPYIWCLLNTRPC